MADGCSSEHPPPYAQYALIGYTPRSVCRFGINS